MLAEYTRYHYVLSMRHQTKDLVECSNHEYINQKQNGYLDGIVVNRGNGGTDLAGFDCLESTAISFAGKVRTHNSKEFQSNLHTSAMFD